MATIKACIAPPTTALLLLISIKTTNVIKKSSLFSYQLLQTNYLLSYLTDKCYRNLANFWDRFERETLHTVHSDIKAE